MCKFLPGVLLRLTTFVIAAIAAPSWAATPIIDISFADSQHFTDIGHNPATAKQSLHELERAFEQYGKRYIGENQTLKIEVLDVSLAGREHRLRPPYDEIRVIDGGADWPVIKLHYTLMADGQTLRSGNDKLANLNYQWDLIPAGRDESLFYEKRMIENWFRDRFPNTQPHTQKQ